MPETKTIFVPTPERRRHAELSVGDATLFLPHYGEFGWRILTSVRYIHQHLAAKKIVCCRHGDECLYPGAAHFFYDWENPIPDDRRSKHASANQQDLIEASAADRRIIDVHFRMGAVPSFTVQSDPAALLSIRPPISARPALARVDVAMGARWRVAGKSRNWPAEHWGRLCVGLRAAGISYGFVGLPTGELEDVQRTAIATASAHPDGPTAGAVDLLSHARLYAGTDTGTTHLAALVGLPIVLWRSAEGLTPLVAKANPKPTTILPDAAWDDPDAALAAIRAQLATNN